MTDTNPSEFTVMTNAAVDLAAQALAGTSKIKFTKVIGSSVVNFNDRPENIAQLTDLTPNNQMGVIKYASKEGNNQSIVQVDFDELNVITDYDLATIGLYASGDDGNEILYAIVCLQYPDHMVAGNSDTSSYYIRVVVGNTANLNVTVSPTGTVSNTQLESALADYVKTDDLQKFIDTSDYAKLKEDNEFKGKNTFDTDPTDSAGNAYAKTVDVNQQLDKKVNVADMRKPASDVAGIEEVSTLQTQVDNSAVGTNLITGTSDDLQTAQDSSNNTSGGCLHKFSSDELSTIAGSQVTARVFIHNTSSTVANLVIWTVVSGFIVGTGVPAGTDGYSTTTFSSITSSSTSGNINIRAYTENTTISGVQYKELKLEKGSVATDWCPNPDDKVSVSDMRKPASDVAGIEEVNAKQDEIGYTPADDSKVAHLSGANNFDTVPTVNNNPLLLASSLPADLARTGQAQTFTQPQTFSIAPVINDASTNKGDNQAATMADLKSVEESAWHDLKTTDVNGSFDVCKRHP